MEKGGTEILADVHIGFLGRREVAFIAEMFSGLELHGFARRHDTEAGPALRIRLSDQPPHSSKAVEVHPDENDLDMTNSKRLQKLITAGLTAATAAALMGVARVHSQRGRDHAAQT